MRSPVSSICMARFGPIDRRQRHHRRGAEQPDAHAGRGEAGARRRRWRGRSWPRAGSPAAVATPCTCAITGWRDRLHGGHQRAAGGEQLGGLVALARGELGEVVPGGERRARRRRSRPPGRRACSRACCSSRMRSSDRALRRSGRLSVIRVIGSTSSTRRCCQVVTGPTVPALRAWRGPRRGGRRTRRRAWPPRRARRRPSSRGRPRSASPSSTARVPRAVDDDPVGPQPAPPRPLVVGGVAPGRRRGRAPSPKPASSAQLRRWLPASGSPPFASATAQYTVEPAVERRRWRGTSSWPGRSSRAPRPPRPGRHTRRISRSAATGSARCWSTWWAWTTSNESSACSRAYTSPVASSRLRHPRLGGRRPGGGDGVVGRVDARPRVPAPRAGRCRW